MSENDSRADTRPVNPLSGIHPDVMYTADEIRRWMNGGEKLAREMAAAGFRWRVTRWRERTKFCLGRDLIAFILEE